MNLIGQLNFPFCAYIFRSWVCVCVLGWGVGGEVDPQVPHDSQNKLTSYGMRAYSTRQRVPQVTDMLYPSQLRDNF